MTRLFWSFLFLLISGFSLAQIRPIQKDGIIRNQGDNGPVNDSTFVANKRDRPSDSLSVFIPTIADYRYKTEKNDTYSLIDTTLTIEKFYAQNFLQKDMFGNMPFPNIGQSLNPLLYENQNRIRFQLLPTGKSFNYLREDEVRFYDVKTPVTEFLLENGVTEGQSLSTTFTHSPNEQINYQLRYRGLRSLGRFQEELASNLTFLAGIRYSTKNKRFNIYTHYAAQQMDNEENGGILNLEDITERQVSGGLESIEVNLTGVQTKYDSRRFRWKMDYGLAKRLDADSATYYALKFVNATQYEKEKFEYIDTGGAGTNNDAFFGSSTLNNLGRRNLKSLENFQNTSSLAFAWGEKLQMEAGVRFENVQIYSDTILNQGLLNIPERLSDNVLSLVGKARFDWKENVQLTADAQFGNGDFLGTNYQLNSTIKVRPLAGYEVMGGVELSSRVAPLNLIYNQSFYEDFNFNNTGFEPVETQHIFGGVRVERLRLKANASLTNINNFTYIDPDARVRQFGSPVQIAKIEGEYRYKYKFWNLATRIAFQTVPQGEEVLPLPNWVGRATVYYQNYAFKKAAEVQIGFNLNYFTSFRSREFFSVLNEFQLQDDEEVQQIGDFPLLDIFLIMKVKRMQIFLRADHVFGAFGERNYFSTPNIPFRNFKVQFGVRWYLFT